MKGPGHPNLETHTTMGTKLNLEVKRQTLRFLHPRNMAPTPFTLFYPTNTPFFPFPLGKSSKDTNTFIFLFYQLKYLMNMTPF